MFGVAAGVAFGVGTAVVNLEVEAAGVAFGVDAGMPVVTAGMPDGSIKLSSATALLFLLVLVHVVLNRLQYPLLKNVML